MRFSYLIIVTILASFLLAAAVSADCPDSQRILRLSTPANAHAELYSGANYPVQICYNEIFGLNYNGANPQTCSGNNLVLRLSTPANAHAEAPSQNNYGTQVCYGDLVCTTRAGNCNANERLVVSLASLTNSHLANDSSYANSICCSSASSIQNAVCGNGILEGAEQCDGANLAGQTCASQGFTGGILSCNAQGTANQCQFDTTQCTGVQPICGNGICEAGESFATCPADCPNPALCGNNQLDLNENCDGLLLGGQTCQSVNPLFIGGTLSCYPAGNPLGCLFDTASCTSAVCGNNIIEPPTENCDGANFGGQTCQSLGFTSGSLICNICQRDESQCVAINGTLTISNVVTNPAFPIVNNGSAQQVTVNFNSNRFPLTVTFNLHDSQNNIINTQGPITVGSPLDLPVTYTIPGNLANGVYTLFMTIRDNLGNIITINLGTITVNNIVPPNCGNGVINLGETCDGANFAGLSCTNFDSFTSGSLSCDQSCQVSTAQCTGGSSGFCGNNVVNPGETCDGSNFNGQTCASYGFNSGSLTCNLCQISTASCSNNQNNQSNGGNGGNNGGGNGNNNGNNGGLVGLFRGNENPSTGAATQDETVSGKKLVAEEQSFLKKLFAYISNNKIGAALFILLILIILIILLMFLLFSGKNRKAAAKNDSLPELPPRKK